MKTTKQIHTDFATWTKDDICLHVLKLYRRSAGLIRLVAVLSAVNIVFLAILAGTLFYQQPVVRPWIDAIIRIWTGLQLVSTVSLAGFLSAAAFGIEKIYMCWIDKFVNKTLQPE